MKKKLLILSVLIISLISVLVFSAFLKLPKNESLKISDPAKSHWFVLHRKSGEEILYLGTPGDVKNSKIVRKFQVKAGNSASSPTPLPSLLGKEYWKIVKKEPSLENPETAPYFLQLDIPATGDWPYGPTPYEECRDPFTGGKMQCDWILPGYFGLHGINGNSLKLSKEDLGSSGCIRHKDEDITYLFNTLEPEKEEIRYYIEDV